MIDPNFWKGRRVFVSGHTGFKGGWLSTWLSSIGAQVTGYALEPDSGPSFCELTGLRRRIDSVIGDVGDREMLSSAIKRSEPQVIFHLAAQSLVNRGYDQPVATFATNVMGTVNLLEAARHQQTIRAVVIVTSDKCYENQDWPWGYRETDPLGGYDPYSASKGCAELVTASYRRSFFSSTPSIAVATVRAGNVVGGGDWSKDRLIPDAVKAVSQGRSLILRNPQSVRPWQHVLEPLSGYLMLAERLCSRGVEFAGAWNFGPNESNCTTVSRIASKFVECWGQGRWKSNQGSPTLHEARHLKLDSSKARDALGWSPLLNIDETIEMTVSWYRSVLSRQGIDAYALTIEQLQSYQGRINRASSSDGEAWS